MVPASLVAEAQAIMSTVISEEELTALAGVAGPILLEQNPGRTGGRARMMLAIGVLLSPALERLRLIYV